jgi:ElaB/YqjD/DUF883 family membrane-anchored ribosome-binding protein
MATGTTQKTMENMGNKIGEETKKTADKAGEQAKNIGERIGEGAKKFGEQAKTAASTATHKVEDAAGFIGDKAENAVGAVGSGMKSLSDTIREHTPHEGILGSASASVADTLETGGRYLEEHKIREMGEDVTNMIRRNPVPAMLVAVGVGFLLARALRS